MKQKAAFQVHLSQRSRQVVNPVQTEEKQSLFIDAEKTLKTQTPSMHRSPQAADDQVKGVFFKW